MITIVLFGNLAKHGFTHGLSSVRLCDKNNEHFSIANVHCLVSHNLTLDSPCPRAMVCCFHLSSKLTETYVNPITKVAVLFQTHGIQPTGETRKLNIEQTVTAPEP